jgi:predicted RNA-binding Zn-ribbon protein involved in translation (DUF1610 family)
MVMSWHCGPAMILSIEILRRDYVTPFRYRIPEMPARKKINLEKVKASLATPCPQCGYQIPPAELRRVDFEQVQCPKCKQVFTPGKPKG